MVSLCMQIFVKNNNNFVVILNRLKGLEKALAIVPSELIHDLKTSKEILILSLTEGL